MCQPVAGLPCLPFAVQGPAARAQALAAGGPVLRRIRQERIERSCIEQWGQPRLRRTTNAPACGLSLDLASRWT